MKLSLAFILFLLAAPGKPRLKRWHELRRLCMARCGLKWNKARKKETA